MDMGRTPTVFVSSTCYDLSQVRYDLKNFIETQMGFIAVLSEYDSFPLDPNISPQENCIRAVKERADIFVLIVGRRYGSITDSGTSVTNSEYINAKSKGIPIYIFVDKGILSVLPIWRANPTADYKNTVDSVMLFKFVDELISKEKIWVYGFENAQEIISALKMQIGYLLYDSLNIRKRFLSQQLSPKVMQLKGESLRIILEKPPEWEYMLLDQLIKDQIDRMRDLKNDITYGISFGPAKKFTEQNEISDYISMKTAQWSLIIGTLCPICFKAIPEAIGSPGKPGDIEQIIYAGERIGNVYEEIIRWGLEFKTVTVEETWQGVIDSLFNLWESPIRDLENYSKSISQVMLRLKTSPNEDIKTYYIDLILKLTPPDLTQYDVEMDIIMESLDKAIKYLDKSIENFEKSES